MKWTKEMWGMAGLCGVSVVAAVASYIQQKKTASLLKKTVTELAAATLVEIEKDVVDQVVQEALEMKVESQVDDILEETRKEIDKKIGATVTTAVAAEMNKCHEKAGMVYSERIANLSEDEVKRLVVNKTAELVEKKISSQFDDIYKQYNRRLDEVNNMYTWVLSKAPNPTAVSNVNPGIHVSW